MQTIVIIGSGLASYTLAREFRRLDTESKLIIITTNDGHYYSKPQLSSALTNKKVIDSFNNMPADTMRQQLNAEVLTNTNVESIDIKNKSISHNMAATKINYDQLVIACGATATPHRMTGTGLPNVFTINDLYSYQDFRKALVNKAHVTILGSGLIGCEFANDLVNVGVNVSVVSLGKRPLEELLPPAAGDAVGAALAAKGVTWHWQTTITGVAKADNSLQVTLDNEKSFPSNLVISAIGIKPNITLATQAGLQIDKGIMVNQYLQTSDPSVYAIGDCAEVCGHVFQYVLPITHAARALAQTLTGTPTQAHFPAMPISIKIPACPVVTAPPPKGATGYWKIQSAANHVKALFMDNKDKLLGFALTGDHVKDKLELTLMLPPVLAADVISQ